MGARLEADDPSATHQLICDRQENVVYVAPWQEAQKFLDSQHPPRQEPTLVDWEAVEAYLAAQPQTTLEECRKLGMFEMFVPPSFEEQQYTVALVNWSNWIIENYN